MSSIIVIMAIIVLLAALLCYAFVVQTITNKRQKRDRLLTGLTNRSRNFKFMLSGFPKGFLPKELTLLVQRSLLHVSEQLAKLDPKNKLHQEDLNVIPQQMAATQAQPEHKPDNTSTSNPKQSQEIKACLEELYKFIFQLEGHRELTRQQADTYRAMIKQLVLQLTVDSYVAHGRIAKDKDKPQLALHYFNLGLKLLLKENNNQQFEGRIAQLSKVIGSLTETQAENQPPQEEGAITEAQKDTKGEWDRFGQSEDTWKKKQVYD